MTRTCTTTQTWIKWDGGECPLQPDYMGELFIKRRDGSIAFINAAEIYVNALWAHMQQGDDITAYTTDIPVVEFDHIPDAGEKVEATRGAGCENEITLKAKIAESAERNAE